MTQQDTAPAIRDRIKELRRVPAKLLDVRPRLAGADSPHKTQRQRESLSESGVSQAFRVCLSDGEYDRFRDDRLRVSLATVRACQLDIVLNVFGASYVFKIFRPVVPLVAVLVVDLSPVLSGTKERFGDKSMDKAAYSLVAAVEADAQIPSVLRLLGYCPPNPSAPSTASATNRAECACFVSAA